MAWWREQGDLRGFEKGGTNSKFVAGLEALWSDEDVHVPSVKYLFQSTSLLRYLTSFTSISTPDFRRVTPLLATPRVDRVERPSSVAIEYNSRTGTTDKRRFTRVIDIQQIAIQIKMAMPAHLHGGVRRLVGNSARREGELRKDSKRRQCHLGVAHGGELLLVDDDFLNGRVRGLLPVRGEGGHCLLDWHVVRERGWCCRAS